ncbi:MAG TPA: hypothetical protein VFS43_46740 [Polyangiaceae bacterium]|nr:hypothetical protein [Polyangiaceae bacterium]
MAHRPRWFPRSRLRHPTSPRLLGVLELPPLGGVALELHLVRLAPGAPCVGAWLDERGRRWAIVEAGRA